jgi:hypothetical protein
VGVLVFGTELYGRHPNGRRPEAFFNAGMERVVFDVAKLEVDSPAEVRVQTVIRYELFGHVGNF